MDMLSEITIRFSGEQGSGVQYTGQFAANYFNRLGYNVFVINDFESRIKGGYSFAQIRISTSEDCYSIKRCPDISIPFSRSVVEKDVETLSPGTFIVLSKDSLGDSLKDYNKYVINFDEVLETGQLRFINTFFVSLLAGLFDSDIEILKDEIKASLAKKGADIIKSNIDVAEIGYRYAIHMNNSSFKIQRPSNSKVKTIALSGSFAISAGAALSNCKFYSAYPMSPSTSIINHLSDLSRDFEIITEQGEDEIAVLNLGLGAAYAGVRSMIGTSGGGLALMSETVSLAAISEVPIVIVNAQRPGPATGLPTRTEQGDLFFTLFIGHGEFTKVLFAPGTHEKAFELTQKAFYIADKYQIPVFILTDQYLMDSIKSCKRLPIIKKYQERFIELKDNDSTPYLRYKFTEDGISPRKIPGFTKDAVVADSHTHEESGLIAEDAEIRKKMVEKLLIKKKMILREDISPPYISTETPVENIVIGWGSSFGVIKEAIQILSEKGFSACHIHFHEIYPLYTNCFNQPLKRCKRIICVENNATGQFASLLKMEADVTVSDKILKYDGRPFYLDELVSELERRLVK